MAISKSFSRDTRPFSALIPWWVYVVRCSDNSLYCGISIDVMKRVTQHNESKRGAKYTRSRRPVVLVAAWGHMTRSGALKGEAQFKALTKREKEEKVAQCDLHHVEVIV